MPGWGSVWFRSGYCGAGMTISQKKALLVTFKWPPPSTRLMKLYLNRTKVRFYAEICKKKKKCMLPQVVGFFMHLH